MKATTRRSAKEIYTEQIVERMNKLNSLKGKEQVNEEYIASLASYKMYELKEMVESLDGQLSAFDLKKEVEAYFADEGKKLHAKILKLMASNNKAIERMFKKLDKLAMSVIKGTPWKIDRTDMGYDYAKIVLCMKDGEEKVFGSDVELSYRAKWNEENVVDGELLCNVGTMGDFNVQAEEANSRAQYFILLGQLLANKELMQRVADESKSILEAYDKAKRSQWNCERVLANPFTNKLKEE